MPNYCQNTAVITATNSDLFKKLEEAIEQEYFMSYFKPTPEELDSAGAHTWGGNNAAEQNALRADLKAKYGYENGNDWRCNEWGTKWDFELEDYTLSDNTLTIQFVDTAWTPPIQFYDFLVDLGYKVNAYYYEPGCNFCGKYDDDGDTCYNIEGDSEWVRANIPSDIDNAFSISDVMQEYENNE